LELLSLDLLEQFAQVGCQCRASDPRILARYWADFSPREWYAVCYHPRLKSFFGMIRERHDGRCEWAWFRLAELESTRARLVNGRIQLWEPPTGWKRGDPLPPDSRYPLHVTRDTRWRPITATKAGLLPGNRR